MNGTLVNQQGQFGTPAVFLTAISTILGNILWVNAQNEIDIGRESSVDINDATLGGGEAQG